MNAKVGDYFEFRDRSSWGAWAVVTKIDTHLTNTYIMFAGENGKPGTLTTGTLDSWIRRGVFVQRPGPPTDLEERA